MFHSNVPVTLALIATLACRFPIPSGLAAEADLVADQHILKLGDVPSGPILTRRFELKNTHNSDHVIIKSAVMACGCGTNVVSLKTVPAKQTTIVTMSINTLIQPAGPNHWKANVTYHREGLPGELHTLSLEIEANLVREILVEPPVIAISTANEIRQTVKVTDIRMRPLTVTRTQTTIAGLQVTLNSRKSDDGKQVQEIELHFSKELPPGLHEDTLIISTDDSACPELRVPIKLNKRRDDGVTVTPESPRVRLAKGQKEGSTLVQLRAGGRDVHIRKVTCSNPDIRIRFSEDAGIAGTIRVIVDTDKAGKSGVAELTVEMNLPSQTRMMVPITWSTD